MKLVLSKKLKILRKSKGYTQEELAEICEVSRQAYSKWETGENLPDVYKLAKLSEILEVSIEELIKEASDIGKASENNKPIRFHLNIEGVIEMARSEKTDDHED